MLTYKSLYELLVEEIKERQTYPSTTDYDKSMDKSQVVSSSTSTSSIVTNISADSASLVSSITKLLEQIIPSQIVSGLTVTATSPASNQIVIAAGTGVIGGKVYNLSKDVTLTVPFTNYNSIFFVNLYLDGVRLDTAVAADRLTIAKIVIPKPGTTNRVINTHDSSWDAYIVNFLPITLYTDGLGNLEEDSIEILRNNISEVLADNIIGNIRLSENLKILNTAGTLELDSNSMKIYDDSTNLLAKYNSKGTYYYLADGTEVARFAADGARVGNIQITPTSLQSRNFVSGNTGFRLQDDGDVEINDLIVRGTIYAESGEIGGWGISNDVIYALSDSGRTPAIQTSSTVGEGSPGIILDRDGLRGYDDVLGTVFNLPTDGSAPTFSSGIINSTVFELQTNAIIRTSETVGDGTTYSYGVLINDTGMYGCGANQTLAEANLKVLASGIVRLSGEIVAETGQIGNVTITSTSLSGGLITGTRIIAPTIESSDSLPKIRIDGDGISYQITETIGKYGGYSSVNPDGFQFGDGTKYATGVLAYLFNTNYPVVTILAEQSLADIHLYNRGAVPQSGTGPHTIGDLIVVNGRLEICYSGGSPGDFIGVGSIIEPTTTDVGKTQTGRIWFRTDV